MWSAELKQLARRCVETANRAAEPDGFVPIRSLLKAFGAELIVQPLLVEGMLAIPTAANANLNGPNWRVLVDQDRFPISPLDLENEASSNPLPVRLRNTVAHELVHTLGVKYRDGAVEIHRRQEAKGTVADVLHEIEAETEGLSPLLLISEKALLTMANASLGNDFAGFLSRTGKHLGVSREVLVSRLRSLVELDDAGMRFREPLRNAGIGIGKWMDSSRFLIRNWPVFLNFDSGIAPEPLLRRTRKADEDKAPGLTLEGLGAPDSSTLVFGVELPFGTVQVPRSLTMPSLVSIEHSQRKPGDLFIFTVRST